MSGKVNREWTVIGAVIVLTALASSRLPAQMEAGYILVSLALVFLIQSLIRDLLILSEKKASEEAQRVARCICLESSIGFIPIIVAAILISAGLRTPVDLPIWFWPSAVGTTLLLCFLIRDYVIDLKTGRLRREKDHVNIVFKWNNP
jgi:hypothetical protein